jgi:hypothetical protein
MALRCTGLHEILHKVYYIYEEPSIPAQARAKTAPESARLQLAGRL